MAHGTPRQSLATPLQLCIIGVSSASNNSAKLQPQNHHGWECGNMQTARFGFLKHFKNANAHDADMLDARYNGINLDALSRCHFQYERQCSKNTSLKNDMVSSIETHKQPVGFSKCFKNSKPQPRHVELPKQQCVTIMLCHVVICSVKDTASNHWPSHCDRLVRAK